MERRDFLKAAAVGVVAAGIAGTARAADPYYPVPVDPKLFGTINRVKDPAGKSPLEKSHAPVVSAPQQVKAGEPFSVEVSVGESLHAMGPAHWIGYIELLIGNEPAGRVDFQPKGYLKPKAVFSVVLGPEFASAGKATLVAYQRCNLHGYWQGALDIKVIS